MLTWQSMKLAKKMKALQCESEKKLATAINQLIQMVAQVTMRVHLSNRKTKSQSLGNLIEESEIKLFSVSKSSISVFYNNVSNTAATIMKQK